MVEGCVSRFSLGIFGKTSKLENISPSFQKKPVVHFYDFKVDFRSSRQFFFQLFFDNFEQNRHKKDVVEMLAQKSNAMSKFRF